MAFLPVPDDTLQITLSATGGIIDNRGIVAAIVPGTSAVKLVKKLLRTLEASSAFIWVEP